VSTPSDVIKRVKVFAAETRVLRGRQRTAGTGPRGLGRGCSRKALYGRPSERCSRGLAKCPAGRSRRRLRQENIRQPRSPPTQEKSEFQAGRNRDTDYWIPDRYSTRTIRERRREIRPEGYSPETDEPGRISQSRILPRESRESFCDSLAIERIEARENPPARILPIFYRERIVPSWISSDIRSSRSPNKERTTILVVGNQDIRRLAGHRKSSKHRKAEQLISQGQYIRILTESDFEQLVALL
jgi:hypothetical protein